MSDAPSPDAIVLRPLGPGDAAAFRALRLRALRESPEAFGSTHEEDAALPIELVAERLGRADPPAARLVVGAFRDGRLVGVAGCMQVARRKARHTAVVWGTYVAPEARGHGVGRRLLDRLVDEARAWKGVERLTLSVVERAHAARALYEAAGFTLWGREPDGLRDGDVRDTVLHLGRAIDPSRS